MLNNKLTVGITGGSGAGKTTVSDIFREHGIEVIDADRTAREIVKKGAPALAEIALEFDGVILPDGTLDRKKLGAIVFSDKGKLETLNRITHKYITERIYSIIASCRGGICAVDGAVLFESGISEDCDVMCAVTANEDVRISRIMSRDGIDRGQAAARIRSQMTDAEYARRCDFVIDNSAGAEEVRKNAEAVIKKIKGKANEEKV